MKKILFQDMHEKEIQVSLSSAGDYRVYYGKEDNDPCLLLNEHQANILINALRDLMEKDE